MRAQEGFDSEPPLDGRNAAVASGDDLVDEKDPIGWGEAHAVRLWEGLYGRYNLNLNRRIVFDWGCSWGYFVKFLSEKCKKAHLIGNDIEPYWEQYDHGWDYKSSGRIEFVAGNLSEIVVPYTGMIDYIFCSSVLQYMRPGQLEANLRKAYSSLRPGGEFIGRTRTYGSYIGQDGHVYFDLPYVHLLASSKEMRQFAEAHGLKMRYLNYLMPSSYFALFARVGFEVIDHRRRRNKRNLPHREEVLARFPWISEEELDCAEVEFRLVRPIEEYELDTLSGLKLRVDEKAGSENRRLSEEGPK